MSTRRAVRLTDVAREAGVGTSIVSRVLNGDPTVSIRDDTRARIVDAARALNYRPNALARGLRLQRTMTLGLIVNVSYQSEIAEIISATERAGAASGYVTLLADTGDFVGRGEAYRRLLFERRVDGLLIGSIQVDDAFVSDLRDQGLPFVVLNRRTPKGGGSSVSVDDALGVQTAVAHLVALGHQRIAYIAGPLTRSTAPVSTEPVRRRLAGFRAGLRAAGISVPDEYVAPSWIEPAAIFQTTLDVLGLRPRPTALVVWSPTAALVALAAAHRLGLRVPDEVSVIAYNDSPIAAYLEPPLTTVRMPLGEMARAAVEALLEVVDGGPPRSHVVRTAPELIDRASTAPARDP